MVNIFKFEKIFNFREPKLSSCVIHLIIGVGKINNKHSLNLKESINLTLIENDPVVFEFKKDKQSKKHIYK